MADAVCFAVLRLRVTAKLVAGVPGRRMGAAPAQVSHARISFLLLRRSTTSAESATRLECVTTITHLPS